MTTDHGPLPPLEIETADEVFGAVPAADVAAALCVHRRTLMEWRRRGVGPPSFKPGRLLTLYPLQPLRLWWASSDATRTRRRVEQRRPA